MKKLLSMAILLALSWSSMAATPSGPCNNTFVKQVTGIGNLEPRIFKDPASANFYLTSADNSSAYISGVNAAGTLTWTHNIKFMGDVGVIKDLVVDQIDGTLAGIVRGNNFNYVFKYNYVTASFSWLKRYPSNYLFMNIHQEAAGNYIVTGAILSSNITIFEVDRNTGAFGSFQNQGNPFTGEFFSTYDGNNIYGACRYYSSGGLFNPSLYEFTPSGINTWVSTYVQNTAAPTARIYPVAPIVDKVSNNILQLSSGADAAFNTYQTGPTKIWLLQTDIAGNLNWTREMIIPGYKQPNVKQIINTATGYYLLTDVYNGSIEDYFFVIKTDKNGKVQWSNRYGINGLNTVISGVESNGYLYLTALSQSYTTATGILFLKLNPSGMSDAACPYIRPWNVYDQSYTNTQVNKPTGEAPTGFSNVNHTASISNLVATDKVQCSTTCPTSVPCSSLTGSLATGVMAFYPFGGGSLNDFSGNGNNLSNPTSAFPVPDRISTPNCAYRFNKGSGDYLTIPAAGSAFLNGMTSSGFSVSLWYQPLGTRPVGDYELLIGRNTGLHCPDTWGEWSVGLYDCRKAVVGFDQYSHWQNVTGCASVMAAMSNSWHHLSFVYDPTMPVASQYSLYIDGTLYANSSGPCGPMSANLGPLLLGADYTGDLDDVIMYNRSLSPAEVMALYHLNTSCCGGGTSTMLPCNTLPGPLASNVMAFYPFGNGSLLDLSGNGNNLNNSTSAYATMDRSGNPTCAYHFERTLGDFLDGPGTYFDNITSGTFSISLWYQPTYDPTRGAGDYELLLGRGNTGLHCPDTWGEWSAGLYDCRQAVVGFDQLSHWESNPARCAAFAAGTPMGWHHLAFVYDPSSSSPYILYIDGTPYMNSHGPCGPMSGNIGQLMLGVDYTGDLDDVIIYNKALTVADVTTLISLNGSCCDGISSSAKKAPLEKASDLKVYPNPTDGKIAVTSTKGMIRQINVYTNTGVLAGTYTFDAAAVTVNLDQLAPGIYFMKVTTDEGTFTEKVVRQ